MVSDLPTINRCHRMAINSDSADFKAYGRQVLFIVISYQYVYMFSYFHLVLRSQQLYS